MMSRLKPLAAIVAAAFAVNAGAFPLQTTAADEARAEAAHARWLVDVTAALDAKGDARSAFFAAVADSKGWALPNASSAQAKAMQARLARAEQLGRDDVLVQWMLAEFCRPGRCDRTAAIERLAELEPDNAAAWHLALVNDPKADVDGLLTRMAQSRRYELPITAMTVAAYDAYSSVDPPAGTIDPGVPKEGVALALAHGYVLAFAIPSYSGMVKPCKPDQAEYAARRERCRAIATKMVESDSLVGRMIGASVLYKTAATDAERADAAQRYARVRWLSEAGSTLKYPQAGPDADANALVAEFEQLPAMRRGDSEIARLEQLLAKHDVSLDPPAEFAEQALQQLQPNPSIEP